MILTVTANPTVDKNYFVDKLSIGEVVRVNECNQTAGGKGINVSKVANLLGEQTMATGFIGGHSGEFINSFLIKAGVKTSFITVDGETRTCININENATPKQTELLEPGNEINAEKQKEFINKYTELLKDCKIVAISGSVPRGGLMKIFILNLLK